MNGTDYYLFNAHGDVTGLADSTGASARAYDYDAFGVEKDPDPLDENPFRYCGEYFDRETETYYLRARYYDPTIGRFTQQDTHWTTANSIYGDNPQKINEHEDKLGLKSYSYAPQITAVMQSGNLYVYGIGNPVLYADANGAWIHLVIGAIAGAIVSGVVSGAAQYATSGKIDFWRILIAMGSGAVSGLLAATGVGLAGQIAGNALISSVANLGDQLYLNSGDITKTNITDVMIAAFIGATGGALGGKGGGTPSLDNLTTQLFRRIGNAVKYQSGAAFKQELSKAIAYYAKCVTKQTLSIIYSILKASIPSIIKEGASTIDQIFKQYGIGE